MDKKIKTALEDIDLIKQIVTKTQHPFTLTPIFLINSGIINIIYIVLEQIGYYFRNICGYTSNIYHFWGTLLPVFQLIGYVILFLFLREKHTCSNTTDKRIFEIWGILFIGSDILFKIYQICIPAGNTPILEILYRCSELILTLPLMIGGIATSILIKDKFLWKIISIFSFIYLILFVRMKEFAYSIMNGIEIRLPLSNILMKFFLTIGLLMLGFYLKKWSAVIYGNKHNTRSISN